jgi:hypothetical protein
VAETPTLRPLGVGEVLDAGIKLYLRHWKPLMICVVGIILPIQIVSALVVQSIDPNSIDFSFDSTSGGYNDELAAYFVLELLAALGILFATAACFKAVADAWLGVEPDARRSLGFALRQMPRLVWLALVWFCGLAIAFLALFVPGIWLFVAWSLAVPALLFERVGASKALGRSFRLVRGRWWPILGGLLVAYLLTIIAGIFVSLVPATIVSVVAPDNDVANVLASIVGGTVSQLISTPYLAAVIALLYFDQRVRKEGFDLQLLAEGLGQPRDPDAPIPAPPAGRDVAPSPPPREWWRDPVSAGSGTYGSGYEAPSSQTPGAAAPPAPSSPGAASPPAGVPPAPSSPGAASPPAGAPPAPSSPGAASPPASPPPDDPAGASSPPPGASPDDKLPERDRKRADWLPPEAPRGPGGL